MLTFTHYRSDLRYRPKWKWALKNVCFPLLQRKYLYGTTHLAPQCLFSATQPAAKALITLLSGWRKLRRGLPKTQSADVTPYSGWRAAAHKHTPQIQHSWEFPMPFEVLCETILYCCSCMVISSRNRKITPVNPIDVSQQLAQKYICDMRLILMEQITNASRPKR